VYCGGAHERPADIKRCWAEQQGVVQQSDQRPVSVSDSESASEAESESASAARPVGVAVRRGPVELGRNVVVGPGAEAPAAWSGAERVVVDAAVLAAPGATVEALRAASIASTGVVIELAAPLDDLPDAVDERLPHEVGVAHRFVVDELRDLVWSNSVDVRDPAMPRWKLVDWTVALGAVVADDAVGDVVLPDGRAVWLDGGPIRHHDPIDGAPVLAAVQVEHGRLALARSNVSTADLAPDQLEAVLHSGGPARIIAPAGSGKTRVLTERARHLIDVWQLPPAAVSLVAFNKRAQEEMRERTADVAGLQVRTLNAIALAIINGVAPFAPQPRRWRTIDEPDVRRLLQRFVTVPRRRNTDPFAPWIDALSLVRLGLVDPAEVEVRYGGDVKGLTEVYPRYIDALAQEGAVDFDGQIHGAIEVLLRQPEARRTAQRASRVLLVDEFQDLTPAHLLLVRLLAAPGGAVFGVGDDDQTIYGYNGADPAWLIDFRTWFPGAGDHPLQVNYRCPAGVVDVADRLLRHNRRRVDKTIRAASNDAGGWSWTTSGDPVAATAAAVGEALAAGVPPHGVAVLTRVNSTIAPVQVALLAAGVPFTGGVGTEFVERTAIRSALAWLRLARGRGFSPDDLGEALRRPSRPLHPRIADWVREQRDVDALLRLADRLTNERDAQRVTEFAGDIARLQAIASAGATTARLVHAIVDDVGLGGAVATLDHGRHGMNRAAQGDDLLVLRQLARLSDRINGDVAGFERWLRDQFAAPRDPGGVTLATVHRVKGQEWPHVVVHLADAGQFPHRLAEDDEEERRLFHVAITRAGSNVTVVSGENASPFVAELTTEPPEHPPEPPAPARQRPAPAKRREQPDHPLLDRGRVLAVPGLVLVDHGHEWVITELEPEAAIAERSGATRRFRIGAKVETAGRQRGELGPRPGDVDEASARVFDRLRQFRDRARNGKPAYTVFDDKTLAAIASALPADLDELARVKGVGPAKLEQYGDDVLALVAAALGA
jgi:DNA helicase-2/ATP-dependent DNA helicase PcrA